MLTSRDGKNRTQLAAEPRIVLGREPEDPQMEQPQREVRDGEDDRSEQPAGQVDERLGHAERQHEHRAHRAEHGHAADALVRAQDVAHPREPHPAPPEQAEHQHPAHDPLPREVVGHQGGHLGEREDEDQIEEQLDRRDARVLRHRLDPRVLRRRHRRTGYSGAAHPFIVVTPCRASPSGSRPGAPRSDRRRSASRASRASTRRPAGCRRAARTSSRSARRPGPGRPR